MADVKFGQHDNAAISKDSRVTVNGCMCAYLLLLGHWRFQARLIKP